MISRRLFLGCAFCALAGRGLAAPRRRRRRLVLCAAATPLADVPFRKVEEVDWDAFYIGNVPGLLARCFQAFDSKQKVKFSDEVPLQASCNSIDREDFASSLMYVGVGNLALYPYSTLVAVIMHELGHHYCCKSPQWDRIESNSVPKQVELLADFMAGAAYSEMERWKLKVRERVSGQCSDLELPWLERQPPAKTRAPRPDASRTSLDPRRLAKTSGQAQFYVLRRGGEVEPLPNNAMIGTMPDEDPTGSRCSTVHDRSLDFLSMVGAVSSWRTFGDRPDTESHGSPSERYGAFSAGYEAGQDQKLDACLEAGIEYLRIGA